MPRTRLKETQGISQFFSFLKCSEDPKNKGWNGLFIISVMFIGRTAGTSTLLAEMKESKRLVHAIDSSYFVLPQMSAHFLPISSIALSLDNGIFAFNGNVYNFMKNSDI